MDPRYCKHWKLINLSLRITHPFHIADAVVVEERLRPLRRTEMHKHRPHPTLIQLRPKIRNVADRLPAERTPEVPQKNQQHRRRLRQREQTRP